MMNKKTILSIILLASLSLASCGKTSDSSSESSSSANANETSAIEIVTEIVTGDKTEAAAESSQTKTQADSTAETDLQNSETSAQSFENAESKPVDVSSSDSVTEAQLRNLTDQSLYCMANIFSLGSLPTIGEPIKDNLYQVSTDKFADYETFKNYIRSIYSKEEADVLLNNFPYENTQKYVNYEGKLCLDKNYDGSKGYYVDWDNYSIEIISQDSSKCDFKVLTTVTLPAENPTPEDYTINATAVFEDGSWKLTSMLY
ncbi:MAG: IseA DL-endopeptidase inhibitor family protein [Ruminococcus sp.]|nr:IseA DL-endopeptidase inhibitor family protein [Ruminococcus sp.]